MLRGRHVVSPVLLLTLWGTLACGSTTQPRHRYSMTGFVFDTTNHVSIAGAKVTLVAEGWITATDENGIFSFDDLDCDVRYALVIEHRNYETLSASFNICDAFDADHLAFFDFFMTPVDAPAAAPNGPRTPPGAVWKPSAAPRGRQSDGGSPYSRRLAPKPTSSWS